MRFLLLTVVALVVAACSTTPDIIEPSDDGLYAGIPTVAQNGPIATAQPVIPTGDPELDDFLAELAAAIDRKDWRGVALRMEPDAFAEQRAFLTEAGRPAAAAQVIAETLGLGSLYHDSESWEGLDRIRVVTFRQHAVQTPGIAGGEGFDVIEGSVRLDDGTTLPLSFSILSRGGARVVAVPLG